MVINGFSLFDLRKLYLDELYEYHEHLFYNLEKTGKIKEGSYDKMMSSKGKEMPVADIINSLRMQTSNIKSK